MMKQRRDRKKQVTLDDYIRASRRGNREAEQEMLGPGFHARSRVHVSKKLYTRKRKHRGGGEEGGLSE